jgi:L-asparaginase
MKVIFLATGGTIDKVYFDALSTFQVGESMLSSMLEEVNVTLNYEVVQLMRKDSLEMTEEDRIMVRDLIMERPESRFVVTHGTDTMVQTAQTIGQLPGKTVILTGALSPARFKGSDALFNLGSAVGAVQAIEQGTFISMNGNLFNPDNVQKNRAQTRFESA